MKESPLNTVQDPPPPPPYPGSKSYTSVPVEGAGGGFDTSPTYPEERRRVSNFEIEPDVRSPEESPRRAPRLPFNVRGFSMSDDTRRCLCLIGVVVGIALLLIVILVPTSFSGLEYYEMGFRRRRTTGSVDTSYTYESGLHFIGPDNEFKIFPAEAHFEQFNLLSVFNADRLEVRITASLQYFLRPHQLKYLHKSFDIHYEPVVRKNAVDAVKGAATVFTNREMILERDKISKVLFKAVRERLGGRCCEKDCWLTKRKGSSPTITTGKCIPGCKTYSSCTEADFGLFTEVRYFQVHELVVPSGLIERYLKALTLGDENQRERLRQDAILIRKETEQQVQQRINEAAETSQNATAWSGLISSRAAAEAKALVEQARSQGLKHLYSELGIRTTDQKNSFDYLRTLRKHNRAQMAVDYQSYIAGPMKSEL